MVPGDGGRPPLNPPFLQHRDNFPLTLIYYYLEKFRETPNPGQYSSLSLFTAS